MISESTIDLIMTYGPTVLQLGLLTMAIYHAWQRNIVKSLISAGACVCTFILGW